MRRELGSGLHIVGLVVMGALLGGCGAEPGTGSGAATPAPPFKGLKIAMIAKSSTNPVFLSARTGAEAAAKELAANSITNDPSARAE